MQFVLKSCILVYVKGLYFIVELSLRRRWILAAILAGIMAMFHGICVLSTALLLLDVFTNLIELKINDFILMLKWCFLLAFFTRTVF